MKLFRFRLQSILRLREAAQEKALEQYGLSVRQRKAAEEHLRLKEAKIVEIEGAIRDTRSFLFDPQTQMAYSYGLIGAQADSDLAQAQVLQAKQEEQKAFNAFLEKKKEVDVFEKLRKRQVAEHFQESIKSEQKEAEDTFNARRK